MSYPLSVQCSSVDHIAELLKSPRAFHELFDEGNNPDDFFNEAPSSAMAPDPHQFFFDPLPFADDDDAQPGDLLTEALCSATKPDQQQTPEFENPPPFANEDEDDDHLEDLSAEPLRSPQQQPLPASPRVSRQESDGGASTPRLPNPINEPPIAPTNQPSAVVAPTPVEQPVAPEAPQPTVAPLSPRSGLKAGQDQFSQHEKPQTKPRRARKSKPNATSHANDGHGQHSLEGNTTSWQNNAMLPPTHQPSHPSASASSSAAPFDHLENHPDLTTGAPSGMVPRTRIRDPSQQTNSKHRTIPSFVEYESVGHVNGTLAVSAHAGGPGRGSKRTREDIEVHGGLDGEEEHVTDSTGQAHFESTGQRSMALAAPQNKRRKAQGNNIQQTASTIPLMENNPLVHPGHVKMSIFMQECWSHYPGVLVKLPPDHPKQLFWFDDTRHPLGIPTFTLEHPVIDWYTNVVGGRPSDLPGIWRRDPSRKNCLTLPHPPPGADASLFDKLYKEILKMAGPQAIATSNRRIRYDEQLRRSQIPPIPTQPNAQPSNVPNTLPRMPPMQQPQPVAGPVMQEPHSTQPRYGVPAVHHGHQTVDHSAEYQNSNQPYLPAAPHSGQHNSQPSLASYQNNNQPYTPVTGHQGQQVPYSSSRSHYQDNNAPAAPHPHVSDNAQALYPQNNQGTYHPNHSNHPNNMRPYEYNAVSRGSHPTPNARMPSAPTFNGYATAETPQMGQSSSSSWQSYNQATVPSVHPAGAPQQNFVGQSAAMSARSHYPPNTHAQSSLHPIEQYNSTAGAASGSNARPHYPPNTHGQSSLQPIEQYNFTASSNPHPAYQANPRTVYNPQSSMNAWETYQDQVPSNAQYYDNGQ